MTTISSAGVGSGLNIESIVTALMSVEKQPLNNLEKRQNTYESKISALGTLKGALSSLQTAAKALTPAGAQSATAAFSGFKANLADSTIATASATSAAVAGTYSIEVGALATNQRLALGKTYDAGAAVLDFGTDTSRTLTLTKGGTAVDITLDTSQNTLAGVRDAINKASAGVNATIITDASGKQNLLLSATDGGTANAVASAYARCTGTSRSSSASRARRGTPSASHPPHSAAGARSWGASCHASQVAMSGSGHRATASPSHSLSTGRYTRARKKPTGSGSRTPTATAARRSTSSGRMPHTHRSSSPPASRTSTSARWRGACSKEPRFLSNPASSSSNWASSSGSGRRARTALTRWVTERRWRAACTMPENSRDEQHAWARRTAHRPAFVGSTSAVTGWVSTSITLRSAGMVTSTSSTHEQ